MIHLIKNLQLARKPSIYFDGFSILWIMRNIKHPEIAMAFAINLFILLVCMFWGGKFYLGVFDDYFMARILEGVYGDSYNVRMTFVNVLYGYALLPLYYLFPKLGWYYIGEIFSVFISFTTVSYVLIKKMGLQWGSIFSTLLVACFARDFYLTVQFTQCAAALGTAGMVLFLYSLDRGFTLKKQIFFSFILVVWAYCMRVDAFLMGLPFFACAILFFARKVLDFKYRFGLCILIMACGLWGAKIINDVHYSTPEYQKYLDFQPHRIMLGDKTNYDQNAVYDEVEEDNLYSDDYSLLMKWVFYDSQNFTTDTLKRITDKIIKYTPPLKWSVLPSKLLSRFDESFIHPCCWACCLICLLLLLQGGKRSLYVWGTFVILMTELSYLIYLQRLVYRVETGLYFYATVLAIPLLKELHPIHRRTFRIIMSAFLISYVAFFCVTGSFLRSTSSGHLLKNTQQEIVQNNYSSIFEYMSSLPDNTVFLIPMNVYQSFARFREPLYYSDPIGSWKKIVSFGFWTPYFPDVENSLKQYGIENPMRDVVKENVVVISNNEFLLDYLHRHYYENAKVDTLRDIGGIKFFKYSEIN